MRGGCSAENEWYAHNALILLCLSRVLESMNDPSLQTRECVQESSCLVASIAQRRLRQTIFSSPIRVQQLKDDRDVAQFRSFLAGLTSGGLETVEQQCQPQTMSTDLREPSGTVDKLMAAARRLQGHLTSNMTQYQYLYTRSRQWSSS